MCAVTAAELNIRITTAGAAQARADLAGVGQSVNAAGVAAGAGMTALGAGLLDQTKSMIAAGATFQQEMQFINTLAGGTAQTSQMLQDEATKLDRTTVFSLQDISQGMEQLAREGFTPLQIAGTNATNSLIQNSANMAAALRINMQDASNMLGMTMRAYQEDVSQTAQVTDILTEAALRSGKSADEFNTQLQYVEATAHQLGIPLQDIAAATGELMSQNVPGAGQGIRAFLVGITSEGSTAQKEMAKLGISAFDAQGQFIGLGPVIDEVNQALKGLTPEEQSAAIKALSGGNRQVTALIQLLRDGSTGLTDFETKMGSLGGAASVMSSLMNTAAGSFKAFMSSLETAKILTGESFLPLIKPVVDGLRELLGAFIQGPAVLHAFAAAAIAVSGVLLTLAGGMSLFKALGMKATLGELVGSLGEVAGTMLPVIALAGAFYLAWEHNFLGFQSLVRGVVGDVQTFADAFSKVFGTNLRRTDPLSAVLASASWGAAAINLQGLSRWFDQLAVSSHAVWLQFSALAGQVMPSLNAAWRELGLANDHAVTAMQDLLAGDLPGALRNWRAAITETQFAWTDFSHALGIVGSNITSLIQTVGSWVLKVGIPKVEGDIAGIASAVWDWVQNTAWPAVQNAARDLGSLSVKVGHWLVSAGEDLVKDVQDWWNKYKIGALVHDYGMELKGLTVHVGGWVPKEAENLSAKVWSWVTDTLWPGVKSAITELGGLAISVGSWAVREGENLATKVWSWITDTLWPGVQNVSASLGGLAISVYGWAVKEGESLSAKVWSWITDVIWPGVQNVSTTLGGLAITVSNWADPIIEGLYDKVKNAIQVDWESNSGSPIPLPTVTINAGKFDVKIDFAALNKDLNDKWKNASSVSPATEKDMQASGNAWGKSAVDNFWTGVQQAFGGGGGGGGLGATAQNVSLITALQATFWSTVRGMQDEASAKLQGLFKSWHIDVPMPVINILSGKDAANLANPFQVIQTEMELQGLKLGEWFKNLHWSFSLPKISITPPSTGDLDLIPGIGPAFAQALGSFSTWVSGLTFSVSIPKPSFTLPSIGLPDFGGLMASVVSGLGSVGDAIKNFKLSFDIPKPSFNWPSIDLVSEAVKHFAGSIGGVIHVPIKFVIDFIQGQSDKKSPSTGGGGQGNDSLSQVGGTSVSGSGSGGVGNFLPFSTAKTLAGGASGASAGYGFDQIAKGANDAAIAIGKLQSTGGLTIGLLGVGISKAGDAAQQAALKLGVLGNSGAAMGAAVADAGNRSVTSLGHFLSLSASEIPTNNVAFQTLGERIKGVGTASQNAALGAIGLAEGLANVGQDLGGHVAIQASIAAGALIKLRGAVGQQVFGNLSVGAIAAGGAIGTFASHAVSGAANTAQLASQAAAAGRAIGQFAAQAATSAASTAVFAAQLASVKSRVDSFTAGVTSGMQTAITAVASAGASIRAAAELIGLSLAAAGTSGGLQFANGIGLGALLAAADMASAGAAIEGIATSIMGALAAAGAAAGASFAAGIAAGMAVAEGAAAAGVGAIIAICSAVDLFGAGFATGASFGAGVAAGLASEEGAVAAEASAIVASAAAASAAAAQIHSPSRLFRDKIGVPIAQGVAVGILSGASAVKDAASSLISLPSLPSTYNASGAISGPSGGIVISPTINVNVDGSYAGSVDELAAQVAERIGPVLVHIGTQQRRGQGALR